jgi:transcriptional regulator with XRE-family HTH domain
MTAPSIYATEVRRVRDAGVETSDIAAATGANPSTVSSWAASRRSPTGERRLRLVELSAIVDRLLEVMEPAYVPIWLARPIRALGDERPLDAIARGDYRAVLRVVAQLENDAFS